jgi:hypothetical protein
VRYRVRFVFNEDTGEVELLRVDSVEGGERAADHDAQHDRVTRQLAGLLEPDAVIEEVYGAAATPPVRHRQADEEPPREERQTLEGADG